jgi:hypothetical protein
MRCSRDVATYSVYIDKQRAERRWEINEAALEIMDKRYLRSGGLAAAPSRIRCHAEL